MGRLKLIALTALAVVVGLWAHPAYAVPATASPVAVHTFNGEQRSAGQTSAAIERAPPAASARQTAFGAADHWSHGDSTRPEPRTSGVFTTYNATSTFAQGAKGTATTREQAQGNDGVLSAVARSDVAANGAIRVRPPLSIPKAQFGTKWGKHAADYGLDAGDSAARAAWLSRIRNVHLNPDEVRLGQYGVYDEAFMFRQGEDLLITRTDGTFVSMYPGGSTSSWFKGAEVFPH